MTTTSYQEPSLESCYDSLIREQDKLIHLGIINNAYTSGKALLSQQKERSKPLKKQNFHNNKPNKGPKPSHSTHSLKNDKGSNPKGKKTKHYCNYCGKDNHDESKCFKKMATLEATMKKHNINLDLSFVSTTHGHALCAFVFFPSMYLLLLMSGSLILEYLIIWLRVKPFFLL